MYAYVASVCNFTQILKRRLEHGLAVLGFQIGIVQRPVRRKAHRAEENDVGNIPNYDDFISTLSNLFFNVNRVLKKGGYCIVNVMDIRKKSNFYPLHSELATALQKIGFIFDDIIIWDRQADYNNMRPLGYPYKFRINKVHEYLLIFIKE